VLRQRPDELGRAWWVPEILVYVGVGTFSLAIIAYAITLTWRASRIEREQQQYTDAQIDNLREDVIGLERGSIERVEILRRETGEMGAALRTKLHEVETWNRDTFVRKESFEVVVNRIEKSIEKMTDKLEDKFDKVMERFERSPKS
jgi:high-affinity Fe2+/Pb2+ permease